MVMKTEYHDQIFNKFLQDCPMWADKVLNYVPKHMHAIRVTLNDGGQIDYNAMTGSFRVVRQRSDSGSGRLSDAEFRETFANNLSEFMRMRGIGQAYLADRTGLSSAMISKYLNRQATIGATNLINIARVLNCDVEELID